MEENNNPIKGSRNENEEPIKEVGNKEVNTNSLSGNRSGSGSQNNSGQNNNVGQSTSGQNVPPQNNTNQGTSGQNMNNQNKKKSKAPIIIVIVIIVVLLLGCLVFGLIFGGILLFSKNSVNNTIKNTSTISSYKRNELNDISNSIKNNLNSINNTLNNVTNNTANNTTNNTTATNSVNAKSSTQKEPLAKGEWGISSKYSTQSKSYDNVYVKVTNFTRGDEAKKIVQDFTNSSSFYKYQEPKEGLEWVVVEYDVDFSDYQMSSLGTNSDVTTSLKGVGTGGVKYNGTSYILTTINIASRDYSKDKNQKGKVAFQMPKGCSDYVIEFGPYGKTLAYFKGE